MLTTTVPDGGRGVVLLIFFFFFSYQGHCKTKPKCPGVGTECAYFFHPSVFWYSGLIAASLDSVNTAAPVCVSSEAVSRLSFPDVEQLVYLMYLPTLARNTRCK